MGLVCLFFSLLAFLTDNLKTTGPISIGGGVELGPRRKPLTDGANPEQMHDFVLTLFTNASEGIFFMFINISRNNTWTFYEKNLGS